MDNSDKAKEIAWNDSLYNDNQSCAEQCFVAALEMAQWKDEQYKTAYVVTRIDLHWDEVERVFFDKKKAEEYCKPFNEDENCYHRNITEIEVSL